MYEIIENGANIAPDVKIGNYTVIRSGAKIGKGCVIGDFCHIDANVVIGENNYIFSGVHITGNTHIGNDNYIEDNTIIGLPSKHIGYHLYEGRVIIGNNNFIGNGCAIDCGNNHLSHKHPELLPYLQTYLDEKQDFEDATIIGDRCYILNNVTIHHNCRIGLGNIRNSRSEYDTVICTGCCLNGFVRLGKGAELGSGTYIREFACLGEGCYTAMSSHIVKDVEPFSFILKNKSNGDATKLIDKYNISSDELTELRLNFKKHRSSKLEAY